MKIQSAIFAGSATKANPDKALNLAEFAFIGRSNVGKSSLVNCLAGSRSLAMTSATPGKTRTINRYLMNGEWYLVDLPGYGFAKAPQKERAAIEAVIREYLNFSQNMKLLFVLVDSRHEMAPADRDFFAELGGSTIPFAVIFTKADKQSATATARMTEAILKDIETIAGTRPANFISSSLKGTGREQILSHIENILKEQTK